MRTYIKSLEQETEARIRKIEKTIQMPERSRLIAEVMENAFIKLKEFIIGYRFRNDSEEILFFKDVKPHLFCRLIFYRKVYNIKLNRPADTHDAIHTYLNRALTAIQDYRNKHLGFYRYYRSGATHLDRMYFLRGGKCDINEYLDGFAFERDPLFSTAEDFTAAKILAGDMLQSYLLAEISTLERPRYPDDALFPEVRLTWQDTKTELYELLFAWHAKGSFGKIPFTRLTAYIQKVFNIELNSNLTRTFAELKLRDCPTPYLDKLTDALLQKMGRDKKRRK